MNKLIIIGTGDYAITAADYLEGAYELAGFAEEAAYRKLPHLMGRPIFDFEKLPALFPPDACKLLVATGPNRVNTVRERLYLQAKKTGYSFITFIHHKASVAASAEIGENSFLFPGSIVEPFAKVGNNCVLWSGAILAHHSSLEDHCFMAPGAKISGRVQVGKNCFIGINATVRDNLVIAEKCIIGGGAVIKKNTAADGVYSAMPAKLISENSLDTKV